MRTAAVVGAVALVSGLLSVPLASEAATSGSGLNAGPQKLSSTSSLGQARSALPSSGKYAFLIELKTDPTTEVFEARQKVAGKSAASTAAKRQVATIASAQKTLIAKLPAKSSVLYTMHSLVAGVGVETDVSNLDALKKLPNVAAVYPVAPKSYDNSYAVPLQGAPQVWEGTDGSAGEGQTIAIIDTGLDYTHANFGGPGTTAAYTTAHAASTTAPAAGSYDPDKFAGGYDLAGDAYNADDTDKTTYHPIPDPDPNPLDCQGHGSHVAGISAGYGENADGSTYTGAYSTATPFNTLKIGPGMAPEAKLYSYRVFGCDGSTDLVAAALDMAADPNGDGDTSDHVDVVNMSLGSDFGSANDGDSIASNAAVALGITVAVAAGNGGDATDVAGSPGDADKVITVANSEDASNIVDSTVISVDGTETPYASERSIAYDWATKPDLVGAVVLPPAGADPSGCTASGADYNGAVVLVSWDANDATRACGSVARATVLEAENAGGFIFGNSDNLPFAAGITGSAVIPGVLINKSGSDAIRAGITAGDTVTVTGTSPSAISLDSPADDNKISPSSSRGIHATGNLKPDVTAVGTTVFSAASGTGNGGVSETGTSMATPMVAGLSALVGATHPEWTPAQIKADIVNTAGQDIYVNGSTVSDTGATYAPVRVGSGRIESKPAVDNQVIAYSTDNPGVASISFGPVEVTGPTSIAKQITVANTGTTAATYGISYDAITSVSGVKYTVSPSSVTVAPGATAAVTVTFVASSLAAIKKSVDPTIGSVDATYGLPRETLAESSGRVLLTPTDDTAPTLRVPVYSAPRPASTMTQAATLAVTAAQAEATLSLTGTSVENGTATADPSDNIVSLASGFELQATSGLSPACSATVTTDCYTILDDRVADIKAVGYTSDFPQHGDADDSMAYIAVSTQSAVSTPASKSEIDVLIDVNGDNTPDLALYSSRLTTGAGDATDVFVATLVDLETGDVVDQEPLDNRFGDQDIAAYDSNVMVLPLWLGALTGYGITADNPRISYAVEGYSPSAEAPVDSIGINEAGVLSQPLSADLYAPGIQVVDAAGDGPLVADHAGDLTVKRDVASYATDGGQGVLMFHFHNTIGSKDQIVTFSGLAQAITFTSSPPSPLFIGASYTVSATGGASGNSVTFDSATPAVCTVSGTTVTVIMAGTCTVTASQAGNADYSAAPTVSQSFLVSGSADLALVTPPTVNGSVLIGKTVTATPGTWSVPSAALTFTYQWELDGRTIPGATSPSYKLGSSALGKKVGVIVIAHIDAAVTSAASSTVLVRASSTTTISLSDSTITTKVKEKVTVKVKAVGSGKEKGTVVVHYGSKSKTDVMHSSDHGKIVVTLPKLKKGSYKVWAEFKGNTDVVGDKSVKKNLKVRKA